MNRLGGMAETAQDLAYRLDSIWERKKWAEEALAYNGLDNCLAGIDEAPRSQGSRQEKGSFSERPYRQELTRG